MNITDENLATVQAAAVALGTTLQEFNDRRVRDSFKILETFEIQRHEIEKRDARILQLEGFLSRLGDHHEAALSEADIALVQTAVGDKIRDPILRMIAAVMMARGIAQRALGKMPPPAQPIETPARPSLRLVSSKER
jgi:hypothetical protein